MENKQFQQLYFLILPPLVYSFIVVLCSSSLHKGGNTYLRYTCMYLPTQEDRWSLSKNHHYLWKVYTQPEDDDDDNNKVHGVYQVR